MKRNFLINAIKRHFVETKPLIEQLTDDFLDSKTSKEARKTAEIVLHMIRSIEYYLHGVINDVWKPLPYDIEIFNTAEKIISLYNEVTNEMEKNFDKITDELLDEELKCFNRPATKGEILFEMLEHSIHHRGQLTFYLRLNNIKPAEIHYII
jgi:uncharacterized damage-inducible protein DinB